MLTHTHTIETLPSHTHSTHTYTCNYHDMTPLHLILSAVDNEMPNSSHIKYSDTPIQHPSHRCNYYGMTPMYLILSVVGDKMSYSPHVIECFAVIFCNTRSATKAWWEIVSLILCVLLCRDITVYITLCLYSCELAGVI